jgi:hypothetical protein
VLNLELQPHVGKVYPLEWHKRGFSFVPRHWLRLLSQGAAWGPYPAYVHLRSIQTLSHLYTSTYFSRICKTL